MTITKITYQNAYITGPYLQHKPGFEAELEEREDPIEALMKLKAIADAFDKKVNNFEERLVSSDQPPPAIQVEKDLTQDDRINAIINDLNACTEIKLLKEYEFLATSYITKNNDNRLQVAYEQKLKELTH